MRFLRSRVFQNQWWLKLRYTLLEELELQCSISLGERLPKNTARGKDNQKIWMGKLTSGETRGKGNLVQGLKGRVRRRPCVQTPELNSFCIVDID